MGSCCGDGESRGSCCRAVQANCAWPEGPHGARPHGPTPRREHDHRGCKRADLNAQQISNIHSAAAARMRAGQDSLQELCARERADRAAPRAVGGPGDAADGAVPGRGRARARGHPQRARLVPAAVAGAGRRGPAGRWRPVPGRHGRGVRRQQRRAPGAAPSVVAACAARCPMRPLRR